VYWLIVRFIIEHDVPAAAVDQRQIGHCDSFLHVCSTVLRYRENLLICCKSLNVCSNRTIMID
jgi:hypothetical protein